MTQATLLALALFAFVGCITPAPTMPMLMASGVKFRFVRSTIPHMIGIVVGCCLVDDSIGLGLHGVLTTAPMLYEAIRWGGAAYLLYLAWRIPPTPPHFPM